MEDQQRLGGGCKAPQNFDGGLCIARVAPRRQHGTGRTQKTHASCATRYVRSTHNQDVSRAARTRARKLDYDQRYENATNASKRQLLEAPTELDPDKAGLGMFYCVECDRHFPNANDRNAHLSSKQHKRIAKKLLTEKPYSHEEALLGAGIGIDNKQRNSDTIETEL